MGFGGLGLARKDIRAWDDKQIIRASDDKQRISKRPKASGQGLASKGIRDIDRPSQSLPNLPNLPNPAQAPLPALYP